MASKVLVKLPTVPFSQQGKKSAPELMTLSTKNEGPTLIRNQQSFNGDRTAQLEQNMKFLQEQHQATLAALHQEVETLRQRNRDLQFQLVFTKSTNCVQSSPSSPEDNSNGFVKTKGSPLCVNVTPLQVELLERDLDEIKASFNDVKKHNQYLLELIDTQKKQLQQATKRKENKTEVVEVGIQVTDPRVGDLSARLEDAEAMIKCIRKENNECQREMAILRATTASIKPGIRNTGSGRNRTHHDNGHQRAGHNNSGAQGSQNFNKFPPLMGQSYWHGGPRGNHSMEHNTEYRRNGKRRQQDKQQEREGTSEGSSILPQLRNNSGNGKSEPSTYPPFYHRSRGYHENSGDYYREQRGNRKYRGQRSQRDTDDHRQDYKDGKEHPHREQPTTSTNSSSS